MNDQTVNALIEKLKALPPEQRAEVEDFVDFLSARTRKRAALDRLLAIVPTLEAAGVAPMSIDEVDEEVNARTDDAARPGTSANALQTR
jgi:hypothetical protein